MKNFIQKYKHIWVLSYTFIYIPWFLYLERTVTANYHVMHSRVDDFIPFNEYFIVPYLLWFVYVAGMILYLFFTNKDDYYKLCTFLFTGMTLSLMICTIFPNGTDFRPAIDPSKNICSGIVAALYSADTCTNVFPSIHVFNSIGVHIAVMQNEALKKHRIVRIGSGILMISICMATVFLKQHSVIDGIGSVVMAYFIYQFVYANGYAFSSKKVREKALG